MPSDIDLDKIEFNDNYPHPGGPEVVKFTHGGNVLTPQQVTDWSVTTAGGTVKEAEEVIKAGHPPMANKVVLIDFDGTIYKFGFLFDAEAPIGGAKEFIVNLKKDGYKIGIFTSRLSKRWLATVNQTKKQHVAYIRAVLKRDGIPFDFITAEKLPCEVYIDDKAIRMETWEQVTDEWKRFKRS